MSDKLGTGFWLNTLFGFFGGLSASFTAGFALCGIKSVAVSFALGFSTGLISGYGILFRLPKDSASSSAIGRYAFWPALMPGLTIANIIYGRHPMTMVFSGTLGFLLALILYFRKAFSEKGAA